MQRLYFFRLQTKTNIPHVPQKGSGQSLVDLTAGQMHVSFESMPPVINQVKQDNLRALAVTATKRYAQLPDIPTVAEGGVPGFDMRTWWGLVTPTNVSKVIITRLQRQYVTLCF